MRQANRIRATPRDELKLDDPVQLGHRVVALFPVPVQANDLRVQLVDHQDVRSRLALRPRVVFQLKVRIAVVNATQAIDILATLTAFDLVVRLLRACRLRIHAGTDQVHILVQPAINTRTELVLGNVLHLSRTLRRVEVRSSKRQQNVVNRHELRARTLLLLVVPHLHVLRATHRELGKHLLLLIPILFDLLSQLPVHVVALALSPVSLLRRNLTHNLGASRAIRWEQLFDRPRSKVYASLSHDRMHHLRGTVEVRTTRRIVPQACTTQSILVLLVALFAVFLILIEHPQILGRKDV